MSGMVDLGYLLRGAAPELVAGEFVFLCLPNGDALNCLAPVGTFAEAEGLTVIVAKERAVAAGFAPGRAFRQITLRVNSSLEAVGFLAAVAGALAQVDIPCNAVSAFHHDHLFVPAEDAPRAMAALAQLQTSRVQR